MTVEINRLGKKVIGELRELREIPFQPTPDIDMVWVLSASGTYNEASRDWIYEGQSADRINIEAGIRLVQEITALRTQKRVDEVTKEDIALNGSLFFYNGEDSQTEKGTDRQNEALREALKDPDFPLPESKVVIDRIDSAFTPSQVVGMAGYLHTVDFKGKIAVVSMIHHSRRVSRYLKHYEELFPDGVEFINAHIPDCVNTVGKCLREVKKIIKYSQKGDLSEEPLEGF